MRINNHLDAQKLLEKAEQMFRINYMWQLCEGINTVRLLHKNLEKFLRGDDGVLVTKKRKIIEKLKLFWKKPLITKTELKSFLERIW